MKQILKRGAILFGILLYLFCFAVPALAYSEMDTTQETSLTLHYGNASRKIANATFSIYRVADVAARLSNYTLSGDFSQYPVQLNALDSAGWKAAAETLTSYAQRDKLSPMQTGKTDSQGNLSFSKLNVGLYLVVGEKLTSGRYTFTPEPSLVLLPSADANEQWVYQVEMYPKYTETHRTEPDSPGGDDGEKPITRKVLKVWNDAAGSSHPQEIVVQLLRDGNVYDMVTLNEANGWAHTWSDLDRGYAWSVTEYEVPEQYKVSISRNGITFVVTNTHDSWTPPETPNTPGNPDNPNQPPDISETGEGPSPEEPTIPEGGTPLPQTGVLWWPVPLLVIGGLLCFLIGWKYNRNQEQEDGNAR
ncbi:MAG: Cna B-type domain-containing protein [bacterium]|nr:Cna B-type domain-containing protein [bacterium]